jgi:predicted SprT family Zn-dependent metalloprotease
MAYKTQRVIVKHWLCSKTAFPHRRNAVAAAKKTPGKRWVYKCQSCGKHHLTTSAPRDGHGRAY